MKVNVEKMNLLLAKKGMLLKNLCEKSDREKAHQNQSLLERLQRL